MPPGDGAFVATQVAGNPFRKPYQEALQRGATLPQEACACVYARSVDTAAFEYVTTAPPRGATAANTDIAVACLDEVLPTGHKGPPLRGSSTAGGHCGNGLPCRRPPCGGGTTAANTYVAVAPPGGGPTHPGPPGSRHAMKLPTQVLCEWWRQVKFYSKRRPTVE
jgi:hypothetical protein